MEKSDTTESVYSRGKIYKITCKEEPDKMYIGSTCEPLLSRRLAKHRADYICYLSGKHGYTTSYEIVKYWSAEITLIELFPCSSKDELLQRERHWIEQDKESINKARPIITDAERKDVRKEYNKRAYLKKKAKQSI